MAILPQTIPNAAPTVLVVDDMPDARDVLARLLRLDGYKSLTAEDGISALAVVEADPPDLILLDLTMPGMDGLDVLRRLQADSRYARLPVILFTAVFDPRLVAEARRLGATDYIVKGSMPATELLARIACHLSPH